MKILRNKNFQVIALLALLSALAYLPFVGQLGYTHDDWYLMYAAKVKGVSVFHTIFAEDRPMRAFVMIPAYLLFGENPLYFNLASYFFRLASGISFLWALRLVWHEEEQKMPVFLMALFFLVYPGFLSHPNGIDYLSHQVALAFAPLSIALSLYAFLSLGKWQKIFFFVLSMLTGFIYLGQMEYYIGLESLRFALLFVLFWRKDGGWKLKIRRILGGSLPFLLASLPFLYWRLFIFESTRGATDTTKQLSSFLSNPLLQLFLWGRNLIEDVNKVIFGAWFTPFRLFYHEKTAFLNGIFFILGFAIIAGGFYWLLREKKKNIPRWQREALLAGSFSLVVSQVPVIMVNRQVSFPLYSRYALPGSLGAMITLIALLYFLRPEILRRGVFTFLFLIALLTHLANGRQFARETEMMNDFWWQVSWRVPNFAIETTLIANYPLIATEEDYFIWGPASQIYYTEGISKARVRPGVYAAVLNEDTIQEIYNQEGKTHRNRRGIVTYTDFRQMIILSQPSPDSCVQLIDGAQPEYSSMENERVMQIGGYSDISLVLTDLPSPTPPEVVFGPEPARGWCYFYQKATLARQMGDWDRVDELGQQASQHKLAPQDAIEWMPFIQAAAMLGDVDRVRAISSQIEDEFVRKQACEIVKGMELTPEMRRLVAESYCSAP